VIAVVYPLSLRHDQEQLARYRRAEATNAALLTPAGAPHPELRKF
jgi:hypothetical protein